MPQPDTPEAPKDAAADSAPDVVTEKSVSTRKGGAPEAAADLPQSGAPGIRFEKVVKRFGSNVVLRELDFTVSPASG